MYFSFNFIFIFSPFSIESARISNDRRRIKWGEWNRIVKLCFEQFYDTLFCEHPKPPVLPYLSTSLYLRDYILKSWLHSSAVNVCNREKGEKNVYKFLSFHIWSAVVPTVLRKDWLSVPRPQKPRPTGLEVTLSNVVSLLYTILLLAKCDHTTFEQVYVTIQIVMPIF